jgi:Uma2 family endonuclease
MSITTAYTAEQLLALPTGLGKRYELVAGELRTMSPSGWQHGMIVDNVQFLLGSYIRRQNLGRCFGAETGFTLRRNPDTVRAPDFSYISQQRIPSDLSPRGYWPGAPDLAVEVLSPGDSTGGVDEKIEDWLAAGCKAVWIIDPKLQTVTVYQSTTNVKLWTAGETLVGDPVVSGFSCQVDELFR